jgi:hypothetical protein
MASRIAAVLSSAGLAACSVVGVRDAEEPRYAVVGRVGEIEIRQYGERIAAETTIAGPQRDALSDGFRRLAGYIFGANQGEKKIAMTAPVAQQQGSKIAMTAPVAQVQTESGEWVERFFMPSQYTLETLPRPTDPNVRLVTVPPETYAVLRFSGGAREPEMQAKGRALLAALAGSAWEPVGAPVAWYYDPPWTLPWWRRNEAAVQVNAR